MYFPDTPTDFELHDVRERIPSEFGAWGVKTAAINELEFLYGLEAACRSEGTMKRPC